MKLAELNNASEEAFVEALGPVFESSSWIAESVCAAQPFVSKEALHAAMFAAIENAGEVAQLALIRAHPDLAGKAARAGDLTEHSNREQSGAGLDRLSDAEFERFNRLNVTYRERFDFPFIIAVRGHTKETILDAFEARLSNDVAAERSEALRNIGLIGQFRLFDLIEGE